MKNNITISVIAIMLMFTALSCKKDDNSSSSNSTSALNNTVQQGNWKITYFNDSGTDETNHFTGCVFQFNSNGTITATKNGSTINGTWTSGNDDSQLKLIIGFSTTPYDELNDDWHVTEQSSSIVKMEDVSGGNGGTDYLTFEKN